MNRNIAKIEIVVYAATNKLYGFLQCFAMFVGQASRTSVSQNYGAGLTQRVRQGGGFSKNCDGYGNFDYGCNTDGQKPVPAFFPDVSNPDGIQALDVSVRYLTIIVWRNALRFAA